MVEKFKQLLAEIIKQKGNVYLFAILKIDELTDKWTVILSAPWINDTNIKDNFIYLRGIMIKNFNNEEMASIARLGVYTKDEHIIEELLKYKEGAMINEEVKVNGNIIHEAHILASNSNIQ
jgi:hypothetical protein